MGDSPSVEFVASAWLGDRPIDQVPTEQLEHQMLGLVGHLAAATCAFLTMVGEYDARRAWESWQALSCAHWLSWHCGVGMVAAREQVRVARRLRELPAIHQAFAAGTISYCKVRAVTRVASTDNQEDLLSLARYSTGSQLEKACSALRRAGVDLSADEDSSFRRRSLSWESDPDTGDLIVRARIPAGLDAEGFREQINSATSDAEFDESGQLVESVDCRRLDALLDLLSAAGSVDSSLAAQPQIVVPPAGNVTALVGVTGHSNDAGDGSAGDSSADDSITEAHTRHGHPVSDSELEQRSCDAHVATRANQPDSSAACGAEKKARGKRFPSASLRREVSERDGGRCRFPGCDRRHRLHVHHIVHWEHGGPTEKLNLILLCDRHHRAIHREHWTLTGTAVDATFTRFGRQVNESAPHMTGRLAEIVDTHALHGLRIDHDGAGSHWQGEHVQWDCFFAAFLPYDPGAKPARGDFGGAADGIAQVGGTAAPSGDSAESPRPDCLTDDPSGTDPVGPPVREYC